MVSRDDEYYIKQSLDQISCIIEYSNGLSYEEFMSDTKTIDAVMFRLQQLIEHIKKLSSEYKVEHNDIPWGDIIGFRNKIVHDYGKTDYSTVYEVITIDICQLKALFEESI